MFLCAAAGIACMLSAEPRYLGVATATGQFWLDNAGVSNHGTIFEGSTIETNKASARLQLTGGVRILLESKSRAQVYGDHLLLEKGRGQMEHAADYRLLALSLQVTPASDESRAIVAIRAAGDVEVAALGDSVRVANAQGTVVANVAATRSVELRPAQQAAVSVLTGCVSKIGHAYVMRDEASAVVVELRAEQISRQLGNRVQLTGAEMPAARATKPATGVIRPAEINVLGTGCATTIAAAAPSGAPPLASARPGAASSSPGTPAAGTSTAGAGAATSGIPTAVIAGVAVAAGAGAAAGIVASRENAAPISPGR